MLIVFKCSWPGTPTPPFQGTAFRLVCHLEATGLFRERLSPVALYYCSLSSSVVSFVISWWWFLDVWLQPWTLFKFKQRLNSRLLDIYAWSSHCSLDFITSKTKPSTSLVKQAFLPCFSDLSYHHSRHQNEKPSHFTMSHPDSSRSYQLFLWVTLLC